MAKKNKIGERKLPRVLPKKDGSFSKTPLQSLEIEDPLTAEIVAIIRKELDAVELTIENETQKHKNHRGSQGGGHFKLMVVSPLFRGLTKLERSRWVYALVDKLIQSGKIHALALELYDPDEKSL